MGKYTPLEDYLRMQPLSTTQVVLTFADIERIISRKLRPGARRYFASWDYRPPGTALSNAWFNAGFQTVIVDLENEKIKFQRIQEV